MLFHSIDFAVFLPLVFIVYWALSDRLRLQNAWIVTSSLVFYGWWDWRFLSLLLFSAVVDFLSAARIAASEKQNRRRQWLVLSLMVNLGLLGFFKYHGFFVDNFVAAFRLFGMSPGWESLHIVLPVGISFYTFQTMSYTIDVYRRQLTPASRFVDFLAYVSFFPQLVAGPIERATHLLPQFYQKRTFSYAQATEGVRQMAWGFFKKLVIADQCAVLVDAIFDGYATMPGSTLLLGAVFFAFQIYGDFSGYSDIAIGTARLFGFSLMQNFAFPYFSRDIAEFWRRWHISLTSWFKDYVYIPLGGSRVSLIVVVRNTWIVFLLSGFWHGASWNFVVWGAWHAALFVPYLLTGRNRRNLAVVAEHRRLPTPTEFLQMTVTFLLVCIGWVFFRSPDLMSSVHYLYGMAGKSLFSVPVLAQEAQAFTVTLLIFVFLGVEWWGRTSTYALASVGLWKSTVRRWSVYIVVVVMILLFVKSRDIPFLYFQF